MDKVDEKIFCELDKNPRIPLSRLAKKLRISSQVADYRLKRLIKNSEILKLATIINLKSLGKEHYRIFCNFNQKKYLDSEIFSYLRNKKGVYWAASIGGKYDLLITLFVHDFQELDKFIDEFNNQFPGLIKDLKSCYVLEHSIYKHKYFSGDNSKISYGYNDKEFKLDKLDLHILSKMKDNCRLNSVELAKGNVSYRTIINRIKNLEKNKIILGYRLFIRSNDALPFIILFSFKDFSRKKEREMLDYLSLRKNVTQSVRMFGIWNLFIHVREKNNEGVQNLLIELRNKFDIIDNFEIIPIFEDISINLMPS
jgi:DNA-binding Lrp family transcriptional regulator